MMKILSENSAICGSKRSDIKAIEMNRNLSVMALLQQSLAMQVRCIRGECRMKTLLLLVCIMLGTVPGQSQDSRYFPSGAFGPSPQSFSETWYSSTLRALEEPSLFALRNDPSRRVYRFLWLPSFHRPISVRLTINADGSGSIVTRSVD